MNFSVVNKLTTVNRFVLHTVQRNITHLAVITRKTNIKLGILKGGETGKEPAFAVYGETASPSPVFLFVPTFDTKVTEYLCSGWVFFLMTNFDFLTSHF